MRIRAVHRTVYRYDQPVYLEPHIMRLRPRPDPAIEVLRFEFQVVPGSGPRFHLDAEGNAVAACVFPDLTRELCVSAETEIRTHARDPFDFLLDDGAVALPVTYAGVEALALAPYRRRRAAGGVDAVATLAASVRAAEGPGTVPFVAALCRAIFARVSYARREHGAARTAALTLARGEGACRDQAVLLVDALRAEGLAARFVSGYLADDDRPDATDLHAWTEVYLPGAGWRGFDPSRGVATGERYVPLAASATAEGTAPIKGSYRGSARCAFDVSLTIESESESEAT